MWPQLIHEHFKVTTQLCHIKKLLIGLYNMHIIFSENAGLLGVAVKAALSLMDIQRH